MCSTRDASQALARLSHSRSRASGGVQEEAPALGKPVLVLRRMPERSEPIELRVARLVGTEPNHILAESLRLLPDDRDYAAIARGDSPYGDGHPGERIPDILGKCL